jgi:hypothetical protein
MDMWDDDNMFSDIIHMASEVSLGDGMGDGLGQHPTDQLAGIPSDLLPAGPGLDELLPNMSIDDFE